MQQEPGFARYEDAPPAKEFGDDEGDTDEFPMREKLENYVGYDMEYSKPGKTINTIIWYAKQMPEL